MATGRPDCQPVERNPPGDFALKMIDFALQMIEFILNMMGFVLTNDDFIIK